LPHTVQLDYFMLLNEIILTRFPKNVSSENNRRAFYVINTKHYDCARKPSEQPT